jgi:hypothetical protein
VRTLFVLAVLTAGCLWGSRQLYGRFGPNAPLPVLPRRGRVSPRKAIKIIYRHVDETLGIRARLVDERAKRHARISFWLSPKLAAAVAPRSWAGVPLPRFAKINDFVRRVDDIRPVVNWEALGTIEGHQVPHKITLHYASEAGTNTAKFIEDLERGRRSRGGGLAQALGLEWHDGMFRYEWNRPAAELTVILREELPAPTTANGPGQQPWVSMPDYPPPPIVHGNGQPRNRTRREDSVT